MQNLHLAPARLWSANYAALRPRMHEGAERPSARSSRKISRVDTSLHIAQRETDGVLILDLDGPLTLSDGDLELRNRLPAIDQPDKVNIILNLKNAGSIDSTGLGVLVAGFARLRKVGGRLALAGVKQSHSELFILTKLAIAFEVFANEHDALDSFFPDRSVKRFDILTFLERESAERSDSGSPTC